MSADFRQSEDLAGTAPRFVELTREVLFGDIWERPALSRRDRSLITVAALVTAYRPQQLAGHLTRAVENGVTREELVEALTHLAFYAGWPSAVTALSVLEDVLSPERQSAEGST